MTTPADVSAGYSWAVRAMVERRLDPRAANAVGVLLAGAARAMGPAGPPSLDAVPGLMGVLDTALEAVREVGGEAGVEAYKALLAAKLARPLP